MKEILTRTKRPTYTPATACFWCCHPFLHTPCVLPISYDAYDTMYTCEGHFCSPECGLAYLYAEPNVADGTRWTRHALLQDLYRTLYTKRDLLPAPPRGVRSALSNSANRRRLEMKWWEFSFPRFDSMSRA